MVEMCVRRRGGATGCIDLNSQQRFERGEKKTKVKQLTKVVRMVVRTAVLRRRCHRIVRSSVVQSVLRVSRGSSRFICGARRKGGSNAKKDEENRRTMKRKGMRIPW